MMSAEELRSLDLDEMLSVLRQMGLPEVDTADAGLTLVLQHATELDR